MNPFAVDGIQISVGASIGVASYEDGMLSSDDLISAADLALYSAKDRGRDRVELFRRNGRGGSGAGAARKRDLRNAITNNELVLYYQFNRS